MQATSERITSLCSALGINKPDGYIPSDDCQINLDELAFSIWRDDEAQRNVSLQCYQLGVFKKDFIPILLMDGPLSYIALKALTAITYPPSPNAEEYDRHINILADYKDQISFYPNVIAKTLEYCAAILEKPRAESTLLNKAELAMTFIRNIAVIPCPPDVHERIFKIFDEQDLFDVIDMLKITRFGDRSEKFARIIADIFYGCFVPYLPIKKKAADKTSALDTFLENQKKQTRLSSARHGHWDSAVTIKGHGKGYTISLSDAINKKTNIPAGKHLVSRARPFEKHQRPPIFSKTAEQAAAKMINSPNFRFIFDLAYPRTFSAYDKSYSVRDQLHLVEMARFFYDFSLYYGPELKVDSLASAKVIGFFISMFTFFSDAPTLTIENITSIHAMHVLCRAISSLCSFLVLVIESDNVMLTDQQTAKGVVSRYAADFEGFLINFLCEKNLTKKSLEVFKDNIIALERLYKLYAVAEREKLIRYKLSRRDEDADPDDPDGDKIEEDLTAFSSDFILNKLARRQGVLKPFFILLSSPENLDDDVVEAMTSMLKRFASNSQGLAHLYNLPYFYIINKLWEDKVLEKSTAFRALDTVLQDIIKKFFDAALVDKTMYIQIISGCDVMDLYDVEYMKRMKEDESAKSLGLTPELSQELSQIITEIDTDASQNKEKESDDDIPQAFDLPSLPSREEIYLKLLQRKNKQNQKRKPRAPPKPKVVLSDNENEYDFEREPPPNENKVQVSNSESDSDNMTLEDIKKEVKNSSNKQNIQMHHNNAIQQPSDESNDLEPIEKDNSDEDRPTTKSKDASDDDMELEDD